jgi:hypothetical protein
MLVSGRNNTQEVGHITLLFCLTLPQIKQQGLDLLVETCRKGEVESCNAVGGWYLTPGGVSHPASSCLPLSVSHTLCLSVCLSLMRSSFSQTILEEIRNCQRRC